MSKSLLNNKVKYVSQCHIKCYSDEPEAEGATATLFAEKLLTSDQFSTLEDVLGELAAVMWDQKLVTLVIQLPDIINVDNDGGKDA